MTTQTPALSKSPDRSGDGLPPQTPTAGRSRPDRAETPQDASDEASLALPHERDQSTAVTSEVPDPPVQQARRDLSRGLQDTSKSPATDRTYQTLKRG